MLRRKESVRKTGPIDVHVGKRIRTRRLLLGMTQHALGSALGITFQQVQKYETGINRVAASRLSAIADILRVPISFFYDGLKHNPQTPGKQETQQRREQPETVELVRLYYSIPDVEVRQRYLDFVKAVASVGSFNEEAAQSLAEGLFPRPGTAQASASGAVWPGVGNDFDCTAQDRLDDGTRFALQVVPPDADRT
jgi:transcriptional regulator with XRE-family HTH domain